nr:hypothetical protein [Tanacetum cinerariifolium]
MESKTNAFGRRTYDMVNRKWKMVRPNMALFCGVYADVMRRGRREKNPKLMDSEVSNFEAKKRDAKRYKSSGSSSFNTESGDASINMNVDARDDEENEVQEVERRPKGMNKAKNLKKKGVGSSGSSSTMNEEALA